MTSGVTPTAPFAVLVVCSGNLCRSVVVEHALRERFGHRGLAFASAGTRSMTGVEIPPETRHLARLIGIEPPIAHSPRELDALQIESADLVLALTREHRADIVRLVPRAHARTVTLREAARLLESLVEDADARDALQSIEGLPQPAALRELLQLMMSRRGFAEPPTTPEDDDVVDPYGRPSAVIEQCAAQLQDGMHRIENAIRAIARDFV